MLFRLSIGGSSCYRIFQDLTGQLAKRSISSSSSLAPEKDSKGSEGGEPQEKFAKGYFSQIPFVITYDMFVV
jgi:hypothetical protein